MEQGAYTVIRRTLPELVQSINKLTDTVLLDAAIEAEG